MNKYISFSGISAIPDPYQATDGDLDISLNLIAEDNQLRPLPQPQPLLALDSDNLTCQRLFCIHKTATFTHYVGVYDNDDLFYIDADSSQRITFHSGFNHSIVGITPVGNTLCVLCKDGMHYFLWSDNITLNSDASYVYLRDHLPEIDLSFGLSCKFDFDYFPASFKGTVTSDGLIAVDEGVDALTNTVMAHVNKLINDTVLGSNRFSSPFFVRYAYRLFDGSLTQQSAPILMLPTAGIAPVVTQVGPASVSDNIVTSNLIAFAPSCKLFMQSPALPRYMSDFADVIQSVDIFVSAPILPINSNGKCYEFSTPKPQDNQFGLFTLENPNGHYSGALLEKLQKYSFWNVYHAIQAYSGYHVSNVLRLPSKDEDSFISELEQCSGFYLIKSIPFIELSNYSELSEIELSEGVLKNIQTRETLPDDYDSHDRLIPSLSYLFNSRLILSNISKQLFHGAFHQSYANGLLVSPVFNDAPGGDGYLSDITDLSSSAFVVRKMFVHINRNGDNYILERDIESFVSAPVIYSESRFNIYIPYFYHPDPNAFKVEFFAIYNNHYYKLSLPLRRHPTLNGAFYFDSFSQQSLVELDDIDTEATAADKVSLPNKLYTSEVDNPFFFPLSGINTIGTGTIRGIATVTEPLSQGQFGYADIYIFSSDGLWTAQINQEGKISNVDTVGRDVCSNPDSITQLGNSVLFTTDRGIMQLFGRSTECISDAIATEFPLDIASLPQLSTLNSRLSTLDIAPFSSFLSGCQMLFNYINQRIIVFNPDYSYAYVYSLRSRLWGMMDSSLRSVINSYPDALAVDSDNYLVSFGVGNTSPNPQALVSRPIKLDSPNALKTVTSVICHGFFPGSVKTILYGSRDLFNWHLVSSSVSHKLRHISGSPYKYFRLVAISTLNNSHSISGISVDFKPRHTHQPH